MALSGLTCFGTDCVLMLQGEGTDGSTTILDSSTQNTKTMTAEGNCQIDTAQFKFGSASILFDGAGDQATAADSPDWDFGTGDWLIETFVRFAASGSYAAIFGRGASNDVRWLIRANNFTAVIMNNTRLDIVPGVSLSNDTWYHAALGRQGTTIGMWIDGVSQATGTSSDDIQGTAGITIGDHAASFPLNGWLDGYRMVKGSSVYTPGSNFTVPSAAFTDCDAVAGGGGMLLAF